MKSSNDVAFAIDPEPESIDHLFGIIYVYSCHVNKCFTIPQIMEYF